ncbi:MAG: hypothetical protein AAGI15_16205 [Pseudomonadota bacterium]
MNDDQSPDPALVRYLARTTSLSTAAAERCVREVLAYYDESLPAFAQRRHRELQAEGELRNEQIYALIAAEAAGRPFAVAPLTERQVRRLIYG